MNAMLDFLRFDPSTRRLSLDANNSAFYRNPNRAYEVMHALSPIFWWEEEKQWYFIGYDAVSSALRDRRFGRQISHIMTRDELSTGVAQPHLADFDKAESKSLLSLDFSRSLRYNGFIIL